jgi:hypothetical protein
MSIKPYKVKSLPEGRHEGKIVRVNLKDVTTKDKSIAQYLEVFVSVANSEGIELKMSAPARIGFDAKDGKTVPTTMLAKWLSKLGYDITREFNPGDLVNKKISFMTTNVEGTKGGTFARVVDDTIVKA